MRYQLFFSWLVLSLACAQWRVEAYIEEPPKSTTLQVEAVLEPAYQRWLYQGTWGGREVRMLDFLLKKDETYWIDHEKRVCYPVQIQPGSTLPAHEPLAQQTEQYLGYQAQWYLLRLSDTSQVRVLWTKEVSYPWQAWRKLLGDETLGAILAAGLVEGLPLQWERRGPDNRLLSRWRVEGIRPNQDRYAGTIPYEVRTLQN